MLYRADRPKRRKWIKRPPGVAAGVPPPYRTIDPIELLTLEAKMVDLAHAALKAQRVGDRRGYRQHCQAMRRLRPDLVAAVARAGEIHPQERAKIAAILAATEGDD